MQKQVKYLTRPQNRHGCKYFTLVINSQSAARKMSPDINSSQWQRSFQMFTLHQWEDTSQQRCVADAPKLSSLLSCSPFRYVLPKNGENRINALIILCIYRNVTSLNSIWRAAMDDMIFLRVLITFIRFHYYLFSIIIKNVNTVITDIVIIIIDIMD